MRALTEYESHVVGLLVNRGWDEVDAIRLVNPYRRRPVPLSDDEVGEIRRMWGAGRTIAAIAREMGVSYTTVKKYADSEGRAPRVSGRRAMDVDVDRIIAMRESGLTFREISAETGVPETTVRRRLVRAC